MSLIELELFVLKMHHACWGETMQMSEWPYNDPNCLVTLYWPKRTARGNSIITCQALPWWYHYGSFHRSKRSMTSQQLNVQSYEPMTDWQIAISWCLCEGLSKSLHLVPFKLMMCRSCSGLCAAPEKIYMLMINLYEELKREVMLLVIITINDKYKNMSWVLFALHMIVC